ncbi:MAG: hypothetical protein K5770_00960 [Lachnospiraceae bacterium]|nr:hypothetical protein [Lachnospiraceae bacterium]
MIKGESRGLNDIQLCSYILLLGALVVDILVGFSVNNGYAQQTLIPRIFQIVLLLTALILHIWYLYSYTRKENSVIFLVSMAGLLVPALIIVLYSGISGDLSLFSQTIAVSFLLCRIIRQAWPLDRPDSDETLPEEDGPVADDAVITAEKAEIIRADADSLMLGQPIPFRWEMENIENFVFLNGQDPQNVIEVVFDLREVEFYVPPLSVRRMVELISRFRSEDLKDYRPVFVTTEKQEGNVRIVIENMRNDIFKDEKPSQYEEIDQELAREDERLRVQCGGSLRRINSDDTICFVMLIPLKE